MPAKEIETSRMHHCLMAAVWLQFRGLQPFVHICVCGWYVNLSLDVLLSQTTTIILEPAWMPEYLKHIQY